MAYGKPYVYELAFSKCNCMRVRERRAGKVSAIQSLRRSTKYAFSVNSKSRAHLAKLKLYNELRCQVCCGFEVHGYYGNRKMSNCTKSHTNECHKNMDNFLI